MGHDSARMVPGWVMTVLGWCQDEATPEPEHADQHVTQHPTEKRKARRVSGHGEEGEDEGDLGVWP